MSSIGKLAASLLSATNENTLALANLNFDFALVKFDAPPEFNGLGAALTTTRRKNAESGSAHKTARRLGALFEQLVPPTPRLVKAYGLRVSEIAETPGVNPAGSAKDGPFQAFLGADGTSIWAAATSGGFNFGVHAPIAVHLLACILARAWEAKVATSIWAELVKERQKEIEEDSCTNAVSASGLMAAQQEITREQLALRDASARAWLRSADEAKFREQKKLVLITKNIGLPVTGGETTYQKVISAWKQSMLGFENIIGGMPQQISDGTILLALSSWHLYPNLIIVQGQVKHAQFKDKLVPSSAVVTIGLSHKDEDDQAIRWSLTLSHLYHYGSPVPVNSTGGDSRVTIQQLHVVALGGLFRAWEVPIGEHIDAANWILDLQDALQIYPKAQDVKRDFPWVHGLATASRSLLHVQHEDSDLCIMLLNFGRRRGKDFLSVPQPSRPFFGLRNPSLLSALKEPNSKECGIEYLRDVSRSARLLGDEAIISMVWHTGATIWHMYATAVPHRRMSQKRLQDGTPKIEYTHARWLKHEFDDRQNVTVCSCTTCDSTCLCAKINGLCGPRCHPNGQQLCRTGTQVIDAESKDAIDRGEAFLLVDAFKIQKSFEASGVSSIKDRPHISERPEHLFWTNPPRLYHNDNDLTSPPEECPSIGMQASCHCFEACFQPCKYIHEAHFYPILSNPLNGFSLYIRAKHRAGSKINHPASIGIVRQLKSATQLICSTKDSLKAMSTTANPALLSAYMLYLASTRFNPSSIGTDFASSLGILLVGDHTMSASQYKGLFGLFLGTQIYEKLEGATIPLSVLSMSLDTGLWIPQEVDSLSGFERSVIDRSYFQEFHGDFENDASSTSEYEQEVSREQSFSCIAMFEAGINVDPKGLKHVVAMAWENSIFVIDLLLADPADLDITCRIKRIIGNVGRPGLTMMVAPEEPQIRAPSNSYSLINHHEYDGKREDNFNKTSLHLSFTQWNVPLVSATTSKRGAIDQDVFFLESVVSVHDQGLWVADLDVLTLLMGDPFNAPSYRIIRDKCNCPEEIASVRTETYTSIDTWDEFLDLPESIGILRARDNWVARLAAVSILRQRNEQVAIVTKGKRICWACLEDILHRMNPFDEEHVVIVD